MTSKRPPKKSDMLEVRVPHETKRAFQKACREEGRNASEVVREFVDGYIARAARRRSSAIRSIAMTMKTPTARRGALAAGAAALGLFAFAVTPSTAQPDIRATFDRLDADGDGLLSFEEYEGVDIYAALEPAEADARRNEMIAQLREGLLSDGDDPIEGFDDFAESDLIEGLSELDHNAEFDFARFEAHFHGVLGGTFAGFFAKGDDSVTFEEFSQAPAMRPGSVYLPIANLFSEERFNAYDLNHDGAVTQEELMAGPARD